MERSGARGLFGEDRVDKALLGSISAMFRQDTCFVGPEQPTSPNVRSVFNREESDMKKYVIAAALVVGIAAPAFADEVGVHAGPVGAGVTVGETHDRDRTVVKERAPAESKTVIKKEDENGNREKTVIHHDHD